MSLSNEALEAAAVAAENWNPETDGPVSKNWIKKGHEYQHDFGDWFPVSVEAHSWGKAYG